MKHGKNNFDAIRLIAAAAVIFAHARPLTGVSEFNILGTSSGGVAVKIFFVISGYLIYTSWKSDPAIHRYLARRALRIFPALIILCVVTVFVIAPLFTTSMPASYFGSAATWQYFRNALLYPVYYLPGMFIHNAYHGAVNGSLWSLPVEFAMYLILPAVCIAARWLRWRWTLPAFTVALCAVSLYLVRAAPLTHDPVFYGSALAPTLDVAPYFFLGASIRHMEWERFLDPMVALLAFCCVMFVDPNGALGQEVLLYLLVPYVVLAVAMMPHPWISKAGRWGDVSYGVYIWAFLVQQCVAQLSGNHFSAMENAFVSLPITLILAWLSWHLIEKRALTFKPKTRTVPMVAGRIAQ